MMSISKINWFSVFDMSEKLGKINIAAIHPEDKFVNRLDRTLNLERLMTLDISFQLTTNPFCVKI